MPRRKTHEEFVAEVKALVGDEYSVLSNYLGSKKEIELKHNECGEKYVTKAGNFIAGHRCPNCFGAKKKSSEFFRDEVRILTNNEYEFIGHYTNARTLATFVHISCGHEFPMKPNSFLSGQRCPKCAPKVIGEKCRKSAKQFVDDVSEILGEDYIVLSEYSLSNKEIKMYHRKCKQPYITRASNVMRGHGCPKCQESKGEQSIRKWLNNKGLEYSSQKSIYYKKGRRPLKLDFLIHGIAVEYDGEYHYEAKKHSGGERGLRDQQRRDRIKDKYCADNGIPLIRIPYWDFDNIDAILTEKLLPLLDASSTQNRAS